MSSKPTCCSSSSNFQVSTSQDVEPRRDDLENETEEVGCAPAFATPTEVRPKEGVSRWNSIVNSLCTELYRTCKQRGHSLFPPWNEFSKIEMHGWLIYTLLHYKFIYLFLPPRRTSVRLSGSAHTISLLPPGASRFISLQCCIVPMTTFPTCSSADWGPRLTSLPSAFLLNRMCLLESCIAFQAWSCHRNATDAPARCLQPAHLWPFNSVRMPKSRHLYLAVIKYLPLKVPALQVRRRVQVYALGDPARLLFLCCAVPVPNFLFSGSVNPTAMGMYLATL